MKICVFGAGAIGGYVGGLLADAGADVTLIARGAHLAAMRAEGLRIRIEGDERIVRPRCTGDPAEAGPQDVVIVALKTTDAPRAAASMAPLLGPETTVVTAANGLPWWYFHGLDGPWRERRIVAVDPDNAQWDAIGPDRAVGCVVYIAAELVAPGIVAFRGGGNRVVLGEPDGRESERVAAIAAAFTAAGIGATISADIRGEAWNKLCGNLPFNPVSVLTGARVDEIAGDPGSRAVIRAMMIEVRAVGEALGVAFGMEVEERIDMAGRIGAHKTSMLQDYERGRPLEVDAIVGAVQELGRLTGRDTPTIDMILALVRQKEGQRQRESERQREGA